MFETPVSTAHAGVRHNCTTGLSPPVKQSRKCSMLIVRTLHEHARRKGKETGGLSRAA